MRPIRLVITRPADQCADWLETLTQSGIDILFYPCFDLIELKDAPLHFNQLPAKDQWTDIIFTSKSAVQYFFKFMKDFRISLNLDTLNVYSIGAVTTHAIREIHSLSRIIEPDQNTSTGLVDLFPGDLSGQTIIIPGAKKRNPALAEGLQKKNGSVHIFPLYENVIPRSMTPIQDDYDYILFTSSSAVNHFVHVNHQRKQSHIITLGPVTAQSARDLGFQNVWEAGKPRIQDVIKLIHKLQLSKRTST